MSLETTDLFRQDLSRAKGLHQMTDEEVKKVQQVVYSITKDIAAICEENGIPYMLGGGSALGAVRHGGFIPWDDDLDVNVYRKDIDRISLLFRRMNWKKNIRISTLSKCRFGRLDTTVRLHRYS